MSADRRMKFVILLLCWHLGGMVDPHPIFDEPLQKARHVFLNPDNPLCQNALATAELSR